MGRIQAKDYKNLDAKTQGNKNDPWRLQLFSFLFSFSFGGWGVFFSSSRTAAGYRVWRFDLVTLNSGEAIVIPEYHLHKLLSTLFLITVSFGIRH